MSKNRQTLTLPRRERTSTELRTALEGIAAMAASPGVATELGPGEQVVYAAPPALRVQMRKLDPNAIVPKYQTAGAAAFDIHALNAGTVMPGETMLIHTGLALWHRDPAWGLFVFARSGLGTLNGIRPGNCVGVIDSDYQGELRVVLRNDSAVPFIVRQGDRIAQAAFMPVAQAEFVEVDQFDAPTARGEGRQGSTGK